MKKILLAVLIILIVILFVKTKREGLDSDIIINSNTLQVPNDCNINTGFRQVQYNITQPANYGGASCSVVNGAFKDTNIPCLVDCTYNDWRPSLKSNGGYECSNGYLVEVRTINPTFNGGLECLMGDGYTIRNTTQRCADQCVYKPDEYKLDSVGNKICNTTNKIIKIRKSDNSYYYDGFTCNDMEFDSTEDCRNCVLGDYKITDKCSPDDYLLETQEIMVSSINMPCSPLSRKTSFKCNLTTGNISKLPPIKNVKYIIFTKAYDQLFHIQSIKLYFSDSSISTSDSFSSVSYNKESIIDDSIYRASSCVDDDINTYTITDPSINVVSLTLTLKNISDIAFIDVFNLYNENPSLGHVWSRLSGVVMSVYDSNNELIISKTLTADYQQRFGLVMNSTIINNANWRDVLPEKIEIIKPYNSTLSNLDNSVEINVRPKTGQTMDMFDAFTAYYDNQTNIPSNYPPASYALFTTTFARINPQNNINKLTIIKTSNTTDFKYIDITTKNDTYNIGKINDVIVNIYNKYGRLTRSYVLSALQYQRLLVW